MNPAELPLRDIHLPPPVGWWPLAPGWWLVALLLLVTMALLAWLWLKRQPRGKPALALALLELERLQGKHASNSNDLLREVSVLLRRIAISQYGRQAVSGLTGVAWVKFLDDKAGRPLFGSRLAHLLTEMPYRPETQAETQALIQAVRMWIRLQQGNGHV